MDLITLFVGFHPDELFFGGLSVDASEFVLVFAAIAATLGFLVWFERWWSR